METKTAPSHTPEATPDDITTALREYAAQASWRRTQQDADTVKMAANIIDTLRAEAKTAIDAAHKAREEARTQERRADTLRKELASLSAQSLRDQSLMELQEELVKYQKNELTRIAKTLSKTRNQRNALAEILTMQKALLETIAEGSGDALENIMSAPPVPTAKTPTKEEPSK